MKSISFARNCLIKVSSFVRQASSSNALILNSDVEVSRTHIPKVPLSDSGSSSLIAMQWPACSSVRSSPSTKVPLV